MSNITGLEPYVSGYFWDALPVGHSWIYFWGDDHQPVPTLLHCFSSSAIRLYSFAPNFLVWSNWCTKTFTDPRTTINLNYMIRIRRRRSDKQLIAASASHGLLQQWTKLLCPMDLNALLINQPEAPIFDWMSQSIVIQIRYRTWAYFCQDFPNTKFSSTCVIIMYSAWPIKYGVSQLHQKL